jgi:cytoskeletal protein CcmA (bactofilin family)
MSIFKQQPKPHAEGRTPAKAVPAAAGLSIIGVGMTVRGDLESNGVVKVEGAVDGDVKTSSQVLVAKGGVVHGDIETTDLVVGGTVNGAVRASGRVEVQAGASVQGDITTRRIFVAEGGSLNGQIRMGGADPSFVELPSDAPAGPRLAAVSPQPPSAPSPRIALSPSAAEPGRGL